MILTNKLIYYSKKASIKRSTIPNIVVLNPSPDAIVDRFIYDYGIPATNIKVYKEFFTNDLDQLFE